jgi:Domain of unknown function (DUF4395)
MGSIAVTSCPLRGQVDPRALRFSAAATASVLAIVLLTVGLARPVALGLLASQVAVYGFTAFVNVHWSVWAQLFARLIWPRIGAATELEDARPARFAYLIGFVLTAAALLGFLIGADGMGYALTAIAVAGAAIRATTGLCLGCRIYLLARRLQGRSRAPASAPLDRR